MNLYNIISLIIILASFFAIINQRFFKLPNNVGVMLIAIVVSILVIFVNYNFPGTFTQTKTLIGQVDFSDLLIGVLLNFLLFAGTIQIRIKELRQQRLPVLLFATLGVLLSTVIIATILYYIASFVGVKMPFTHWLLFGALISPTDPVSVLGLTKEVAIPKSLETKIAGESLFNDGIALVLFVSILHAIHNPDDAVSFISIGKVFLIEVLGAIALGIALGFIGLRVLAKTPDPKIHVMFSLAMVMGGQLLADKLNISAPLTMVSAGIFFGNFGKQYAMDEKTVDYLDTFWEIIDEILNVVLFALIGFQLLFIKNVGDYWKAGLIAIPVVLLARFISVYLPSLIIRLQKKMPMRVIMFLTWGGLRGGISIALALTLSSRLHKDLFLFITYCVVVFSVVVQGLSLERLFLKSKPGKRPVIGGNGDVEKIN